MAKPTKSTGAEEVVRFIIENIIAVHGVPNIIFTDNASGFRSKLVEEVANAFGFETKHSTPYYSQGNGLAERAIQTLKDKVAMTMKDAQGTEWDDHVAIACLAINATTHTTTKFSPYEVLTGRKLRLPREPIEMSDETDCYTESIHAQLELIRRRVDENMQRSADSSKRYYDSKHQEKKFNLGDKVLIYFDPGKKADANKFTERYRGPYVIEEIKPHDIYKTRMIGKKKVTMAHVSRIKPYISNANEPEEPTPEIIDMDAAEEEIEAETEVEAEQAAPPAPTRTSRRKQQLTPINYASLAALFTLMLTTTAQGMTFMPSETVLWNPSAVKAVSGLTQYTMSWRVVDPCDHLFGNIAKDQKVNEILTNHCHEIFKEDIQKPLSEFCDDSGKNSTGYREKRLIGDIIAVAISGTSMVMVHDIKKNDIPYLRESIDQIHTVLDNRTAQMDKLKDELIKFKREIVSMENRNIYNTQQLEKVTKDIQEDIEVSTEAAILLNQFTTRAEIIKQELLASKIGWNYEKKVNYELLELMGV